MNIPWSFRAGYQVILHRVDGPIDITHRVMSLTIDTGDVSSVGTGAMGADAVVSTITMTLDGDEPLLSPQAISPLNSPRPLLRPYRRITVRAAEPDAQLQDLFVGFLGDSVRVDSSASTRRLSVTGRDIAKPFQDTFLRTFPVLGGVNATIPSVLQQLINLVPAAMRPDLVVPEQPNLLLSGAYQPTDTTVWDVMQQLVTSMGWYLGARGSELHLLNPPRGANVPDRALDTDDVFQDDFTVSDTDVRNRITVEYNATGASVTHEDTVSINDITDGVVKHSHIRYASDSPINTASAANQVAQDFLHDMSRPHAITRLNLPFIPSLKVFSILGVRNPFISADTRLVAVTSVRHIIEKGGKARTVVLGAERVLGAHSNWLAQETQPAEALGLEAT